MSTLLIRLREATRASHDTLDAAFGSLDLSTQADYVRFLKGHAIGMNALFASFHRFVTGSLAMECPDYPAMLGDDLLRVGERPQDLPSLPAPQIASVAAVGYVIAGSRLGLAAIASKGYWGRSAGLPSAYMDDRQGLAIWKQAAAWLKDRAADEEPGAGDAAVAAFETFRAAFVASALAPAR